jgi:hypothetical protein
MDQKSSRIAASNRLARLVGGEVILWVKRVLSIGIMVIRASTRTRGRPNKYVEFSCRSSQLTCLFFQSTPRRNFVSRRVAKGGYALNFASNLHLFSGFVLLPPDEIFESSPAIVVTFEPEPNLPDPFCAQPGRGIIASILNAFVR